MVSTKRRLVILGAGGRDFHNFNVALRGRDDVEVVAFTATQIPGIENRVYPPELAGPHYPKGIPIIPEESLPGFLKLHPADEAVFAYSDVAHEYVMTCASRLLALGLDFRLMGPDSTQVRSVKPVIAVTAIRTGCGKSQTTRKVCGLLRELGSRVVAIRHPMPYGDLVKQGVQRFATVDDLARHECTIEEMEEYEPHIASGTVVYAGVDYEAILRQAEQEADVVVWDGGNNDLSFYKPDLTIVVLDPLRAGHELRYHPGHANFLSADVIVINKIESASREEIETVRRNIREQVPSAIVIDAASPVAVAGSEKIRGRRVLVVEDGPTLTHGGMKFGAGIVAAQKFGAAEIVDPRPYLVGEMAETFRKYPGIGPLLPAMGYGDQQIRDLEATIRNTPCDLVLIATPIDLRRIVKLDKEALRVGYDLEEIGEPKLGTILARFQAETAKHRS
ncbi:MAG: GTPase [Candidatus Eisenbacteria bacterium]|nr:GTPase [Candidatus Eisenbacteria bacterium]MCC7144384.1 GTPase [Candidatus Eisenbacteria bacterium]